MIVRNPTNFFIDGAEVVDVSNNPFTITLQPGWNQIGNPYDLISTGTMCLKRTRALTISRPEDIRGWCIPAINDIEALSGRICRNNGGPVNLKILTIKTSPLTVEE
jgi:hypothetical protein